MLFHQFPDLQWLKKQSEQNFADRKAYDGTVLNNAGWPTVILNVKSNSIYRDNIRGPLSLFSNENGSSAVSCDGKRSTVNDSFFFLTNADQRYTLEIEEKKSAETLNIHFGLQWCDEVLNSIQKNAAQLLDEPVFEKATPVEFYNKLYRKDDRTRFLLTELKSTAGEPMRQDEILYELLVHLVKMNLDVRKQTESLAVCKKSTRDELSKRLFAATDHIYSNLHLPISLDELAGQSCLSKFHFLRLFRTAFDKSPLQFINEAKVERATSLLKHSKLEVNEIASAVGFNNSSSFSRMFYNQTGVYPSQVR